MQLLDDRANLAVGSPATQRQRPPVTRQRVSDAKPDPARAAGDERDAAVAHDDASDPKKVR